MFARRQDILGLTRGTLADHTYLSPDDNPPKTHQPHRICEQGDCDTILSVYNPAVMCYTCQAALDLLPSLKHIPRDRLPYAKPRICKDCYSSFTTRSKRRSLCYGCWPEREHA